MPGNILWRLAAGLMLAMGVALAAAAPGSGSIQVRVRFGLPDGSLQPLPGAMVTLFDREKRQVQQSVTDDSGTIRFEAVPPGDYIVLAEMEAFKSIRRRAVVAAGGETAVELELPLEQFTTTVDVSATSRVDEQKQSALPAVLQEQLLRSAPLVNEQFQDALPLVPGVLRGPDGLLNLKGARTSQSGLLVNSINVTDPVTGQYAMELPIEAIESITVHANPYSAEYGKFTGAVTAIETRQGSDEFKFLFTNFMPRLNVRDGSVNGFESFTPRLAVSGAIVPGRLWYMQNLEYRYILTEVPSLAEHENETGLESFDSFTRLDWDINEAHRATAVFSFYPQNLSYVNLDTFRPQEATPNFRQRGGFLAFSERAVINLNSVLETTFSIKEFDAYIWGNSPETAQISPEGWSGGYYNTQDRRSRRYEWSQVFTFNPARWRGRHQAKAGYILSRADFTGSDTSREVQVRRADGTLFQRIDFVGPPDLDVAVTEFTAFAQDNWQVAMPLTLDTGLRLDWDSLAHRLNLAPRLGLAWLPFPKDNRTVLRGGIGLFYDKIPLNAGVFEQYQSQRVTFYDADGQTVLYGPTTFDNVLEGGRLRNTYSLTWNVELDRELTRWLTARFGYQDREQKDDLVIEPQDAGSPALLLSNRGSSSYHEWLVSFRFRFRRSDQVDVSYVRSSAEGNMNSFEYYFGNYHFPIVRFDEYGRQSYDVPNRLIVSGTAGLPWGLILAPVVDWRDGFPYSSIDERQSLVSSWNGGGRFPALLSVDLTLMKRISLTFKGKEYKISVGVKIFNLTNHWNPRDVQNNVDSPEYGTFFNSIGRTFRGKFEFDF